MYLRKIFYIINKQGKTKEYKRYTDSIIQIYTETLLGVHFYNRVRLFYHFC